MSIFGWLVSFSWPALLAALPVAAGALLYIYRRRARGEPRLFPSFFLIEEFKSQAAKPKQIFPPPRFYFEILLFTLLILGAAGMSFEVPKDRVAVLIDNSFSMSAMREPGPAGGLRTRLDLAVLSAKQEIERLGTQAVYSVSVTSPDWRPVSIGFESKSDALERLNEIKWAYAADGIESALQQVLVDRSLTKVVVFTDKSPEVDVTGNQISDNRIDVRFIRSTSPAEAQQNIAITALRLIPSGRSALHNLEIGVSHYSTNQDSDSIPLRIKVFGIDQKGRTARALVEKSDKVKAAAESYLLVENIPAGYHGFAVKIEIAESATRPSKDDISEDNWGWIAAAAQGSSILLVSDFDSKQLGLSGLRGFSFERKSLQQAKQVFAASGGGSESNLPRFIIFHRAVPAEARSVSDFPANALVVLPPKGNPLFEVSESSSDVKVTGWIETHPLTRYANMTLLELPSLEALKPRDAGIAWTKDLISTSRGAAALVSDRGGRRLVALGFEIFPFGGRDQALLSVLTLNIFKWLSETAAAADYLLPYSLMELKNEAAQVSYLDYPEGAETPYFRKEQGAARVLYPGLVNQGSTREATAVNYFDASESDVTRSSAVNVPQLSRSREAGLVQTPLTIDLARAVLLLLCLDILLQFVIAMRAKLRGANA